jgi:hypothetical protein
MRPMGIYLGMTRILTVLTLAVGALAFAAASSAHDGKGDHHGHHKGNTLHYKTTLTTTDTGTCGQQVWATDTLKRVYAVHRNQNGSYTLTVFDRGTFVTSAAASPGACEQGSRHGTLVTAGIKGRVLGYIAGKVTGGTFTKDAACAAVCDRPAFIAAHFGPNAKFSCDTPTSCRYAYLYTSRDDALKYHHWLDAGRADSDGPLHAVNRGDIATT